ncbi:MAG: hypothetical protein ACREEO_12020 [Phenylobacterium sp.]
MTRTNTGRSIAACRAFLLGIAFTISAAPGAQSAEVTGDCLWELLPSAAQDRMIIAYAKGGSAAMGSVSAWSDLEAIMPCIVMPSDSAGARKLGAQVALLQSAVPVERASGEYLATHGYPLLVLEDAWRRLGAADRETLRSVAEAVVSGRDPEPGPYAEVLLRAADLAGRPVDLDVKQAPRLTAFSEYFLNRAIREAVEAQ